VRYREGAAAGGTSRTALDDCGRCGCAVEKSSDSCPESIEESGRDREWVVRVGMSCCASEGFRQRFSSIDYERATRISRDEVSIKNAPILLQVLRLVGRVTVNVVITPRVSDTVLSEGESSSGKWSQPQGKIPAFQTWHPARNVKASSGI
jgi:hypothetical protein